jgi:hypothetical protein
MSVILLCGGRRGGRRGGRTCAAVGCDAGAGECEGLRREADAVTVLPSHCTLLTVTSSAPALRLRSENSAAPEGTPCAAAWGTPCATNAFSCSAIACVHAWETRGSRAPRHATVASHLRCQRDAWVWLPRLKGRSPPEFDFGAGPAVGEREETAEKTSTWRCSRAPFDIPDRKSFDHQLHGRASFLGVRRRQRRRRRDVVRLRVRVAVGATTHRGTVDPSRCRGGARDERGRDVSTPPTMPWSVDRTILAAAFQQCRQPRRQGWAGLHRHRCTRVG